MTETSKSTTSFVVVERDHRGWTIVGGKLYREKVSALMAAAGLKNAIVLPARRKRLRLEAIGSYPERKTVINVDWSACVDAGRKVGEDWYAVRVAPGVQKTARPLPDAEANRVGESVIERRFRDAGIDVYMPAFLTEIRTHRRRKLRARRLPLMPGYVFIRHDAGKGFDVVRDVDGVIDVVMVQRSPVVIPEDDVRFLMVEMFEREQSFLFERAKKAEEARFKRRLVLHAELGRHLPRGRGRGVSLRAYADACIERLPDAVRTRVMGIISALDALKEDDSLDEVRDPV